MRLSVLTPAYNSGSSLERAINSVLIQDLREFEHIVVDGASTDSTIEVLNYYDHIRWISEPDQGQSDAMNKAFEMSSGDVIAYLNADDYFEPGIFSKVVSYFERNQDKDMVVGNLKRIYPSGVIKLETNQGVSLEDLLSRSRVFPTNPVSYFYKRELQDKVGPFPLEEHYTMDYWFILRAFHYGEVGYLDEVFGTFVLDGTNKTMVHDSSKRQREILLEFCQEFYPELERKVRAKLRSEERTLYWRKVRSKIRLRTRLRKLLGG